jgi:hypothetical protein
MESSPEFMQLPLDYQVCEGAAHLRVSVCLLFVCSCVFIACARSMMIRFQCADACACRVMSVNNRAPRRAAAARRLIVGHRPVRACVARRSCHGWHVEGLDSCVACLVLRVRIFGDFSTLRIVCVLTARCGRRAAIRLPSLCLRARTHCSRSCGCARARGVTAPHDCVLRECDFACLCVCVCVCLCVCAFLYGHVCSRLCARACVAGYVRYCACLAARVCLGSSLARC